MTGHPLYQRIIRHPPFIMPWYMGCVLILLSPFVLLPAIVFLSAVYGLRWSVQIADSIAKERENGMYDLLVVSPPGILGISRTIMSACLNRNDSLEQIEAAGTWFMRGILTVILMLLAASVSPSIIPAGAQIAGGLIIAVYLATMGLAIYIEHLQSIVIAVEIGIWIPSYATRRLDASAAAFMAYLVIQVASFLLTLVVGFSIAPALLQALNTGSVLSAIALPFIRLVIFVGSREFIIRKLWQAVVRETQATPSEVEFKR